VVHGLRLNAWMQAHQLFSYEHDFVRRGLVGEVLRQLHYPNTPRPMYFLSAAVYFALAALTARLAWEALPTLDDRRRQMAVVLLLVLPFALPHFAFDLGRGDSILYLMALPVIVWRRAPLLACAAIGVAGVLVHELFVVVQLPLLVWFFVGEGGWRDLLQRRVMVLVGAAAVAFVPIALYGNLDSISRQQFHAEIQERIPGYHEHGLGSPHTLLHMTAGSEVRRSLADLDEWSVVNVALSVLPAAFLLWAYLRLRGRQGLGRVALMLAPCSVLVLMGHDLTRWVSLASFNLLIALLVLVRDDPIPSDAWSRERLRVPVLLMAATVLGGPIGVITAYPIWDKLLDKAF